MGSIDLNYSIHHPPILETAPARVLEWSDENATAHFATRLARAPGIGDAFIALQGDLGAGKTTLVRHLLRALGVTGRIKSPTYAVVEPYEIDARDPPMAAWHFDFYRFADPREWEDAGFRDIFAGAGLKIAEWPDKAASMLPVPDLTLHIEALDERARRVTVQAGTPRGTALLQATLATEAGA